MHRVRQVVDVDDDRGFSLVELLVVIIIIGILAGIAIPLLWNQRKKAYDAGIKSDLRTVANDMESYYSEFDAYPQTLNSASFNGYTTIGSELVRISNGNTITVNYNAAADAYCLQGTNPKAAATTGWFYVSNRGGLQPTGTAACGSY